MSSSNPQMKLSEKQKRKRKKSSESSLPLIPKKARSKVQASKNTYETRLPKKSSVSKNTQVSNQDLSFICHKARHLVPDDKLLRGMLNNFS